MNQTMQEIAERGDEEDGVNENINGDSCGDQESDEDVAKRKRPFDREQNEFSTFDITP